MPLTFWLLYWTFATGIFASVFYYIFLQDYLAERKQYKAQDYRFNKIMRETELLRFEAIKKTTLL
ncbi:gp39 [Brochothrix phage BL3]|uniref:gp39 n=1 Tax=Brochothrix phage BL3 TaxID=764562 RepID=UPI0001D9ADD0|nr:gp39 [Brochothrix phage BL3]ADH03120.1 gp39 [Brochothrix phage BL3]